MQTSYKCLHYDSKLLGTSRQICARHVAGGSVASFCADQALPLFDTTVDLDRGGASSNSRAVGRHRLDRHSRRRLNGRGAAVRADVPANSYSIITRGPVLGRSMRAKGRVTSLVRRESRSGITSAEGPLVRFCHIFRMSGCPLIASRTATAQNFTSGKNPQRCRLSLELLPKRARREISLSANRRREQVQQKSCSEHTPFSFC